MMGQRKGYRQTEKHKLHISLANKGKKMSFDCRQKASETRKKLFAEGKLIPHNKGQPMSEKQKQKISNAKMGQKAWNKGVPFSIEARKKMSNTRKQLMQEGKIKSYSHWKNKKNPMTAEKLKGKHNSPKTEFTSEKVKEMWRDAEYRERTLKKIIAGHQVRPTSLEKQYMNFCQKYNIPHKYVGNGEVIIGGINPDFIDCNGQKQVVEVFHPFFKIRTHGSVHNYMRQRSAIFSKYGFKVLFLQTDDFKGKEWEQKVLEKVNNFVVI